MEALTEENMIYLWLHMFLIRTLGNWIKDPCRLSFELNYTEKVTLGDSQRQQVPKDEAQAPAAVPPAVVHSDSV